MDAFIYRQVVLVNGYSATFRESMLCDLSRIKYPFAATDDATLEAVKNLIISKWLIAGIPTTLRPQKRSQQGNELSGDGPPNVVRGALTRATCGP